MSLKSWLDARPSVRNKVEGAGFWLAILALAGYVSWNGYVDHQRISAIWQMVTTAAQQQAAQQKAAEAQKPPALPTSPAPGGSGS